MFHWHFNINIKYYMIYLTLLTTVQILKIGHSKSNRDFNQLLPYRLIRSKV